ncbi:MAG: undecaprenyl-diphosphate phosphatase [Planctomycetota bacterium]|nr:undecaprenyl-diphosphate phosphatase [Planctomycetota bacterium]
MDAFDAALLGATQGAAEFLPVSSSAHLSFLAQLLHVGGGVALVVFLHLPTLLCIFCFYGRDVVRLVTDRRRELAFLAVATVPGALVGYLLKDAMDSILKTNAFAGVGLVFTGTALIAATALGRGNRRADDLSLRAALLVGFIQAGAVMPGVSRLGMCLSALLLLRLSAGEVVRLSILLSLPMTLGAALLKSGRIVQLCSDTKPIFLVAGGVSAFVVGVCSLWLLLRLAGRQKLWIVGVYCWGAGIMAVALS